MAEFTYLTIVFRNLVQSVSTADGTETCAVFVAGAVDEGYVVVINGSRRVGIDADGRCPWVEAWGVSLA